jgi:biopolymer transport protein ExbD
MKLRQFDAPAEETRIELIPLLDVVFCILIFFLFATIQLTRQQAIDVALPTARTGQPQQRQLLVVSIDAMGQTYADQQPIPLDLLILKIKDFQQRNPDALLVLYADRNASYSEVVRVLDLMRTIGGDRVALATLPPSTQSSASPNPTLSPPQQSPFSPTPGAQSPLPQSPLPQLPQSLQPSLPGQTLPGQAPPPESADSLPSRLTP